MVVAVVADEVAEGDAENALVDALDVANALNEADAMDVAVHAVAVDGAPAAAANAVLARRQVAAAGVMTAANVVHCPDAMNEAVALACPQQKSRSALVSTGRQIDVGSVRQTANVAAYCAVRLAVAPRSYALPLEPVDPAFDVQLLTFA